MLSAQFAYNVEVNMSDNLGYGKCSKILNAFFCSKEMLIIRAGTHKMLVSKANRKDPDQTASEDAV